jgi:hypothetical protein
MKKYLITVLLAISGAGLNAQIVIGGSVKSVRTGELLGGANVTLHTMDSDNIIGYSICDSKGNFSARATAQTDSIVVRVAYLGYAEQRITVAPQSQNINFSLDEKEFVLKEAHITAPKIRTTGDTLSYSASQFTREQDRVLTDILDRMPGVEISKETGLVKYQGKPINRFYVENQNLMDGRYGEVSKNLPADAVKTVEIFENHQPVRALQDVSYSDQAAMNIKLTDKAKGKWIGNGIAAGLGVSPLLWKAEFSAMRFSPDVQTYLTCKTNNIGQDIKIYDNFISIQLIGMDETNTNAFYSPFITSPALSSKRSLFNRSHVVSVNNLWKAGKESSIRFFIDYKNEEKEQESRQTTQYFLADDSTYTYNEKYNINSYENKLSGRLTYTRNDSKIFLENRLGAEAEWQKINSKIYNGDNINQHLRLPSFEISNNFRMILRSNTKQTYHIASSNTFKRLPQRLASASDAADAGNTAQIADIKTFDSENSLAFGHSIKRLNINYDAGYNLHIDNYGTGGEIFSRSKHNVNFTPSLTHSSGSFNANLMLPLSYINISGSDNIDKFSGLVFEPSLRIRQNIGYFWELSLSGNLSSDFGSIYDIVSGVMKDYRTQYVFDGALPRQNTASAGLGLNYKNPIKALFGYLSVSYSNTTSKNTGEQTVNGAQIINRIVESRNKSQGISANGYLSKIFDWQRCSAKLNLNISQHKSEQLRNAVTVPFSTFSYSINPSIDIETFASQMLNYSVSMSASRSVINSIAQPFMYNLKQNFTYYIPVTKKINLMIVGEHLRNQISAAQYVNMFLMDAIVRYKVSPKFEFTLNWNNIFDTREYSYSYYNDLYYTSYSYKLRPMNILFTANLQLK